MREGLIKDPCGCTSTRSTWVSFCAEHAIENAEYEAAAREHRSVRPKKDWNKPTDNFEDLI